MARQHVQRPALGPAAQLLARLPPSAAASHSPQVTPAPTPITVRRGAAASCAGDGPAGADPELEQWAFGFASAVAATMQAQQGGDPLAGLDAEAIHAWLADHCRRRPLEALSVALARMVLGRQARWRRRPARAAEGRPGPVSAWRRPP